mgnify:CR=1 FL=1
MKQAHWGWRALTACALTFAAQAAFAQAATAQASITGFSYELIDLDPTDGIAPTLTWLDPVAISRGYQGLLSNPGSADPSFSTVFSNSQEATGLGASTLVSNGVVSGSTSADELSASAVINAYGTNFGASAAQGGHFTLSANTQVVFSAQLSSSVSVTPPAGATYPNGYFDWAYGQAYAGGEITILVDGYPVDFLCCSANVMARDSGPHAATEVLTHTFTNATSQSLTQGVVVIANVGGYTLPTMSAAVPEADTWTLALIGLSLMGLATRRRRQA